MTDLPRPFMGRVFVGKSVEVGSERALYGSLLAEGESVEMEFKAVRDGAIFSAQRLLVYDRQGLTGKKIEFCNFPWHSISAFSVENSGTFDLDANLQFCGAGWGVCQIDFAKGTDMVAVLRYINSKLFGAPA